MILAFDLGGTFLRCAASTPQGAPVMESMRISARLERNSPADVMHGVLERIEGFAQRQRLAFGTPQRAVVAFPGPVCDGRSPLGAPTVLGGFQKLDGFADEIERRLECPVYVLNDVSAAAWHIAGETALQRFMVVTISSGIGSKFYDRSYPQRVFDDRAYSGEIGHIRVDWRADAAVCDCGGRGHLGAIASGRGIERIARRRAAEDALGFARSIAAAMGGTAENLQNESHIAPAARIGDSWIWSGIREALRPLAQVLAGITCAVDLEALVIIGGFARAVGPRLATEMGALMNDCMNVSAFDVGREGFVMLWPEEQPCLRGAIAFAQEMPVGVR